MKTESIGYKVLKGISATFIRTIIFYVVGAVGVFVFAKTLGPDNYAIYPVINNINVTAYQILAGGFIAVFIINEKLNEKEDLNNVFWFIQFWFTCLSIVLFFYALFFVQRSTNSLIIFSICFLFLFFSFRFAANVILNRNMEFGKLAVLELSEIISFIVFSIFFILLGFQIKSFAYSLFISTFIMLATFFVLVKWRPSKISFTNSVFLIKNNFRFFINIWVNLLRESALIPILGLFIVQKQLGVFSWSLTIASFTLLITSIITITIFPALSKIKENSDLKNNAISFILRLNSVIVIYLATILFVSIPLIINIFFDKRWEQAIIPCRLLIIAVLLFALVSPFQRIMQIDNHVNKLIKWEIIMIAIIWLAGIPLASQKNIIWLAAVFILANLFLFFKIAYFSIKNYKLNYLNFVGKILILGILITSITVIISKYQVNNYYLVFILQILAVTTVYGFLTLSIRQTRQDLKECWRIFKQK